MILEIQSWICHFCAFQPRGERKDQSVSCHRKTAAGGPTATHTLPDRGAQARMLITTSFLNPSLGGSSSLAFDYLRAILGDPGCIKQSCCAHYYGPSLGLNEPLENRPFYSVCLSLNCSPAPKAWIDCAYLCLVMSLFITPVVPELRVQMGLLGPWFLPPTSPVHSGQRKLCWQPF